MGGFVHLHLHTEYSLLDGATRISTIADKALSDGQSAVAITDHGVMYGAVEFYKSLKAKGVKPIIGCEVYVAARGRRMQSGKQDSSGHHLVLLCKDAEGYKNLCYMVSESFITGFYSKPRVDMELLRAHHKGLIALSGCVGGKIPQLILAGSMSEATSAALEMKEIFGEDFYLEVQNHGMDEERRVAFGLRILSDELGIPLVATNDVHYLEKVDADVQATLMCVQTNSVITDGRPLGFENDEYYFKTEREMDELFRDFPSAVSNTVVIADKCNFDFEFNKLHLPDFVPEDGLDHRSKLRLDTYAGFEKKIKDGRFDFGKNPREVYTERIEYELSVIDTMGFNAYFLIVADFVSYAKSQDIPVGPGRGSGAGSLVAFCIGITDVDPIVFDLLFERFLNPERVSMPDFDIDFCYTRREEVIEYVKRKYGEDKVAQIVTFGTLAPRAAVRDVGRALGMSYGAVDSVAKLIPSDASSIESALSNKELRERYQNEDDVRRLIDVSRGVEGMPRHASTHAAGVVITKKATYEYVPLSYSGTGIVTQFDMNTDAELGLVKFDFLGLRYITVLHDAEMMIKRTHPEFDLSDVGFDDPKTFKLMAEGRTDGVFQLESGGMKAVLGRLQPTCLEDIIACVALFRPGPMDSIDKFVARKHGREKVEYEIEQLRSILDVTYGCIVYQEQVMQICRTLAGYSYARADIVRRAMSKKKTVEMQAERESFIKGCLANGVPSAAAESIFEEMLGFAKYAFNKSHATAYAITSYRTAYLKAHYPAEYFAALLSSVLSNTVAVRNYIADAQKMGIGIDPPDINSSESDFTASGRRIRFGLTAIKNVGPGFSDAVVRNRATAPYRSFDDFVERMGAQELNKRTVESLIKCGVFDSLGVPRRALMMSYESILTGQHEKHRSNISGQMDMFSMLAGASAVPAGYEYPSVEEYPLKELLQLEKESSGMYFSGHMVDNYSKHIESVKPDSISDIIADLSEEEPPVDAKYKDKGAVTVAGIVTEKKTKVTKNGDTMAFITLEDSSAEIGVIVFVKQFRLYSDLISQDSAVIVRGNISHEEGKAPEIILSSLTPLIPDGESLITEASASVRAADNKDGAKSKQRRLFIKVKDMNDERIVRITRIANFNRGDTQIVLYDCSTGKYNSMKSAGIDPSEKVMTKLYEMFSAADVVLR